MRRKKRIFGPGGKEGVNLAEKKLWSHIFSLGRSELLISPVNERNIAVQQHTPTPTGPQGKNRQREESKREAARITDRCSVPKLAPNVAQHHAWCKRSGENYIQLSHGPLIIRSGPREKKLAANVREQKKSPKPHRGKIIASKHKRAGPKHTIMHTHIQTFNAN